MKVVKVVKVMKGRPLIVATCLAVLGISSGPSAQPIPVSYTVRLASATVYDTRAREEDTIHASLTVFVNGERKAASIWDGKGWDGSRTEGRVWVTGLHVFGTPTESTLHVSTGRLQDSDTVQIVFEIRQLRAARRPAPITSPPPTAFSNPRAPAATAAAPGNAWLLKPRASSAGGPSPIATDSLRQTSSSTRRCSSDGRRKPATPSP